jgi:hypothetical protein
MLNLEKHTEKLQEVKNITDSLSERVKRMEVDIEKMQHITDFQNTISERMENMEKHFKKIEEDMQGFVTLLLQKNKLADEAKKREDEIISEAISEGFELLEISSRRREDRGKVCDMFRGAEALETPFKKIQNSRDVSESLSDTMKKLDGLRLQVGELNGRGETEKMRKAMRNKITGHKATNCKDTISERMKHMEENFMKIQNDMQVFLELELEQRAKNNEDDVISEAISKGLDLLENAFMLKERRDVMSEGVEMLEAPSKEV